VERHFVKKQIIKHHWVFDIKSDRQKKAHLVAKGFSQYAGTDYNDIYLLVIHFETIRLILELAALENWHIIGLDVRNAYVRGYPRNSLDVIFQKYDNYVISFS